MPGTEGPLWHTIRRGEGSWQNSFDLVESEVHGGPPAFAQASCAATGAALQLVGVGSDGQLWHTIRYQDGSWQSSFGMVMSAVLGGPPAGFAKVGCGGTGDDLQVVGLGANNRLYHTIRRGEGYWQSPFVIVDNVVKGGPPGFRGLGCAATGADLQLVGLGSDFQLWHTIRREDGSWQSSFGLVEGVVQGGPPATGWSGPGEFLWVGCGAVGNDLHLVGVGTDGQLWHTIRYAEGSWQSPFGLVEGVVQGGPPGFAQASCAGTGADLQLVGLASVEWQLYHTIRREDGSWQSSFDLVQNEVQGGPAQFFSVACASGPSDALHVLGSEFPS